MSAQRLVIVTEHLSETALSWLSERCRVEQTAVDSPQFATLFKDAEALIVRTYTNVDQAMLARAPKLKVVGRAGVGLDNIDRAACRARGIKVVYTPDANTQAVVEYVYRLLLEALRPVHYLNPPLSADDWKPLRDVIVGRRQLNELTLGIMGLGRIGKRIAEIARAFGMRVIFHDVELIPTESRHRAQPVSQRELFSDADVLTVHIDGRPENRTVIDDRLIQSMKPNVIFINTSRGFVLDHAALASFLAEHPNAQAILDVHDPEPIDDTNPLLGLPNALLLPHLASRTQTAMENMSWVVKDVWAALDGCTRDRPEPHQSSADE